MNQTAPMRLGYLLEQLPDAAFPTRRSRNSMDRSRIEVLGITPDYRRVGPGILYVASPGEAGRPGDPDALHRALEKGAAAVICSPDEATAAPDRCIGVQDLRQAMGRLAST
jgi:UDP-N-acetylmuramyl tripeptide synthase